VMPEIGFLQQAFEWRNMNVVFYPYFWGRYSRWAGSIKMTAQADPMFAEFLTSGAARVQLPIRPEMSDRVLRFIETRTWPTQPADGQVLQADGGVGILTELLEAMDHPDDAIPVGDPWEFTMPANLVLLDDEATLNLRDPLKVAANQVQLGNGDGFSKLTLSTKAGGGQARSAAVRGNGGGGARGGGARGSAAAGRGAAPAPAAGAGAAPSSRGINGAASTGARKPKSKSASSAAPVV
jgi:hypothetical protein